MNEISGGDQGVNVTKRWDFGCIWVCCILALPCLFLGSGHGLIRSVT